MWHAAMVVIVAVAVLVTFFVCWAPFHAQRVLTVSVPDGAWTSTLIDIQSTLFYVSGSLTNTDADFSWAPH